MADTRAERKRELLAALNTRDVEKMRGILTVWRLLINAEDEEVRSWKTVSFMSLHYS